jgi:DNA invertase Pin-like site-specific DNA recombinase
MQDMVSKGRKALMTRDNNTETKIFTKDIKTIKELYGKEKVTNIAKMFNVSRQAIYRAVKKYEGVTI